MNILNELESKLSLLDNYTKTIPDLIKDKISSNIENNVLYDSLKI